MTGQSKLTPVTATCIQYVHPWQDSCTIATAGLLLQATQYSLRTYSAVYLLSLLMRCRIPSARDLKRTILGIIQSSAFLTTNAISYCLFLCIIRKYVGSFNFFTAAYVPAFMSSACALLIERPSRRGLLSLYVSNVATETIFNMAVVRGLIRPIPNGQVIIFGVSSAILLYFYRRGLHRGHNDSIFDILRYAVGECEEEIGGGGGGGGGASDDGGVLTTTEPQRRRAGMIRPAVATSQSSSSSTPHRLPLIMRALKIYSYITRSIQRWPKHRMCPHRNSCVYYALQSGTKLFSIGLGIQLALKLVLQMKRIFTKGPRHLLHILWSRDTMQLGVFLGGFSALFRVTSCLMRHCTGKDHPMYAVPAGLAASLAFFSYPDTTVALYAMWKMLQNTYNIGVDQGYLPHVPHFTFLLYCCSTAMLFHAGILEPLTLRQNYWKFLHSLSGGRLAGMNREILDIYGLDTSRQLAEALQRTRLPRQIMYAL